MPTDRDVRPPQRDHKTRKPCPGCGETHGWRATVLCAGCRGLMKDGVALREITRKAEEDVVQLPFSPPSYPHFSGCDLDTLCEFRLVFDALAVLASEPTGGGRYRGNEPKLVAKTDLSYGSRIVRIASPWRDALRRLYAAVQAVDKSARQRGLETGRNFVAGLCDGSVSIQELNEATIGGRR